MSTSFTTNVGLGEPALNDASWATTLNTNWTQLDAMDSIGTLGVTYTEFPSATLNIRCTAGVYRKSDGTVVSYAGTGSFALSANQTNSLYLTDAGTLTNSTSGFPAATNIVTLATIVTGSGTVTSITPARRPWQSFGANANTIYAALAGATFTGPVVASGSGNSAGFVANAVTIPGAPVEGQICDDSSQLSLYGFIGSNAGWFNRTVFSQTQVVNFNTSSSATALTGTGKGSLTLAANALSVGKVIRVRASGFLPTTKSASPGTLNFQVKIGSIVVGTLATAPTLGTSITNGGWSVECDIAVKAIGAGTSTNVSAQGLARIPTTNSDATTMGNYSITNAAVSSGFDSTATQAVGFLAQFSVSDVTNSISATNLTVELLA